MHQKGLPSLALWMGIVALSWSLNTQAQTPASGAPFFAVNGHWRQEFGTSPGANVVTGWGWQGVETKRRLRLGLNYYNGPSLQYEFFDRWENLVGAGIWMDY